MADEKLEWALKNGDVEQLANILEQNPGQANASRTRPPLCIAADYGQLEVLTLLLDKGADINVTDKHGITPLLAAIFEGHTACVKVLLEKGADKSGKAPDGSTYLESAEKAEIQALLKE